MLIVSDRQVAGEQKHFFPIFVNEWRCRVDAWREAQQSGPTAALVGLVERARQDLLLNARGIPGRSFPSLRHVERVEFVVGLVDSHWDSPRRARRPLGVGEVGLCADLVGQIITGQHPVEQRRYCIPVTAAEGMSLGNKSPVGRWRAMHQEWVYYAVYLLFPFFRNSLSSRRYGVLMGKHDQQADFSVGHRSGLLQPESYWAGDFRNVPLAPYHDGGAILSWRTDRYAGADHRRQNASLARTTGDYRECERRGRHNRRRPRRARCARRVYD